MESFLTGSNDVNQLTKFFVSRLILPKYIKQPNVCVNDTLNGYISNNWIVPQENHRMLKTPTIHFKA